MFKFSRYVQDTSGNVQTSGTVDVWVAGTGQTTRATIYSDNTGTAKANPFSIPGTGLIEFFLANQRFDVTATTGAGTITLTDQLAFDSDEFSGDVTFRDSVTVEENFTVNGNLVVNGTFTSAFPAGSLIMYGAAAAPTGWLVCDGSAVSRSTYSSLFAVLSTSYGAGDGSTTFNIPDMRSRVPLGYGQTTNAATVASGSVDIGTDTLTSAAHPFYTGSAVVYTTSGTTITGLTPTTTYYVISASSSTFKLASSLANAVAGTAIDLTGAGTGNHTFTQTLSNRTLGSKLGEETHALTPAEIPTHSFVERDTGVVTNERLEGASGFAAGEVPFGGSTAHNIMPPSIVVNYIIKT